GVGITPWGALERCQETPSLPLRDTFRGAVTWTQGAPRDPGLRDQTRSGYIPRRPPTLFLQSHFLSRLLLRLLVLEAHADPARFVGGGADESETHLVGRLFAEGRQPRRVAGVVRVGVAVVVIGFDVEARAGLHGDRLLEPVRLLPVVVPVGDVH